MTPNSNGRKTLHWALGIIIPLLFVLVFGSYGFTSKEAAEVKRAAAANLSALEERTVRGQKALKEDWLRGQKETRHAIEQLSIHVNKIHQAIMARRSTRK